MPRGHTPVVGHVYSVLCPVCYNSVNFDCLSRSVYGVQCHVCHTVIDLRNPSVPLPPNDPGVLVDPGDSAAAVWFSPEVEESGGCSATTQLSMVLASVVEQQQNEMPTTMSRETQQAFSARRMQALSERFSFFYPLVYAIEYVVFGTKPVARVGRVRIFRKRLLPCCRPLYVPVPETSVSYSTPLLLILFFYFGIMMYGRFVDEVWLWQTYFYITILTILSITSMLLSVYTDPGFVHPAYLDNHEKNTCELTLKDIEAKQRESQWETVNGQPVERKWCSTCELYRPMRAAHCYLCGMCILEHDHHCSVIGVCVGRRNVRMFSFFVAVTGFLAFFASACILLSFYNKVHPATVGQACLTLLLVVALVAIGVTLLFLVLALFYFFAFEITTRERLQDVYRNKKNPFSRGVVKNILWHVCHPTPPSLFDDEFVQLCATKDGKRDNYESTVGGTVVDL